MGNHLHSLIHLRKRTALFRVEALGMADSALKIVQNLQQLPQKTLVPKLQKLQTIAFIAASKILKFREEIEILFLCLFQLLLKLSLRTAAIRFWLGLGRLVTL